MADKKTEKKVVVSKKKNVRDMDKRVLSERLFENEKREQRNDRRNRVGCWLVSVGGAVAFVLILAAAVTQCAGNKRAADDKDAQNKELKEELRQAQERIEKLYGRVCRLDSKLEDCEQDKRDCQPCKKPTPKPVAKPAPRPVAKPKPAPKPAPMPQPKPVVKTVVVYDTVVVRADNTVTETPVAQPVAPVSSGYRTLTAVTMINLSENGYCASSATNNGKNTASTAAADTVRNAIVADTISNAR